MQVVFTAGAMGAGKSHAMKWLAQREYFPLESFVMVDPDQIRYKLPEMAGYLANNQLTAGTLTHKESGFIQEILTLEALSQGKNVLIDGSLRNAAWNRILISRIYNEHPKVKIAIIHVSASQDEVMKRAARRAEVTGRVVPEDVLLNTMKEVPQSVKELSPLVDYSITLNTDDVEPVIESSCASPAYSSSCSASATTPRATGGRTSEEKVKEDSSSSQAGSRSCALCECISTTSIDQTWDSFAQRWVQECSVEEGVSNRDEVYSFHFQYDSISDTSEVITKKCVEGVYAEEKSLPFDQEVETSSNYIPKRQKV
jgi:hypothetical protein